MWLLRKLRPDFKTIADFRKNGPAIKRVCREFTLLCKQLDLFGGELVAINGSKFPGVNGRSGTSRPPGWKGSSRRLMPRLKRISSSSTAGIKKKRKS